MSNDETGSSNEEKVVTTKKTVVQASPPSIEDQVDAQLRAEFQAQELKVVTTKKRKQLQDEKNSILVRKAFEAGLTDAPRIAKEISMSEQGVRRYAEKLGIQLIVTKAERQKMALAMSREIAEEAERLRFGIRTDG